MSSKNSTNNPELIRQCILALGEPVRDRKEFLRKCMLERFEKANKQSMKDFDYCLEQIEGSMRREEIDFKLVGSAVKKLVRVSKRVHKTEIALMNLLHSID